MEESICVIFCISAYTQKSYRQNIELTTAHDSNKNIWFIVTSEKFNPNENMETNTIIGKQRWKPLYNETYVTQLITDILLQYG